MGKNVHIDPATGKPQNIDLQAINDASHKAVAFFVTKIEKDGIPIDVSIRNLLAKDGKAIMDAINEIMKGTTSDVKEANA